MRIWVGFDGSDIGLSGYFSGAIVSYGTSSEGISAYCWDANERVIRMRDDEIEYVSQKMKEILEGNGDVSFVFSDPYESRLFFDIEQNIICRNPMFLLRLFNSKTACRAGLKSIVPMLPYVSIPGAFLDWRRLVSLFPGTKRFLLQSEFGAGGKGSHIVEDAEELLAATACYDPAQMLSISPCIETCLSVNQTVLIAKNNVMLFQPSIQIIADHVKYQGADFSGFKEIPPDVQKRVFDVTKATAEKMRQLGYRGVAGIDLILDSGNVYFGEINPRFQGSSFLLDRVLFSQCGVSLYELNEKSFKGVSFSAEEIDFYARLSIDGKSQDAFYMAKGDERPFIGVEAAVADGAQKEYPHYDEGVFLHRSFLQ